MILSSTGRRVYTELLLVLVGSLARALVVSFFFPISIPCRQTYLEVDVFFCRSRVEGLSFCLHVLE